MTPTERVQQRRRELGGYDGFICPKCLAISGDDWSQCHKSCPVVGSPHYDAHTAFSIGVANSNRMLVERELYERVNRWEFT